MELHLETTRKDARRFNLDVTTVEKQAEAQNPLEAKLTTGVLRIREPLDHSFDEGEASSSGESENSNITNDILDRMEDLHRANKDLNQVVSMMHNELKKGRKNVEFMLRLVLGIGNIGRELSTLNK